MIRDDRLIEAVRSATRRLTGRGAYDDLMRDVLQICVEAVGAYGGTIYLHDPVAGRLRFRHVLPEDVLPKLPMLDIPDDFGFAGRAFGSRQTVCAAFPVKEREDWNAFELATDVMVRSIVATPLAMDDTEAIGVVQLLNKTDGEFDDADRAVLDTIASVATMAFHNARLTRETERAGALLGMGKVSHDIGNLAASLHATLSVGQLGVTELEEKMAEPDPDREECRALLSMVSPTFEELDRSIDRIVGYSRLISDMSAGRELRPTLVTAAMGPAIETSASYFESDARSENIEMVYDIGPGRPTAFDELFLFRIVQNLVGNAIKAVRDTDRDGGTVTVRYRDDGDHVLEVVDTGSGMSREVADRILSGTARSEWGKAGGSGWGSKIVLELAKALSATVEIDTRIGNGSTFRVRFPHREEANSASSIMDVE